MTGYYDKGILIIDRKLIAKNYLKSGLLYDSIAFIPIIIN